MKCLVVDDSSVTRRIAVNTLRALGFDPILEAATGERALELCDPSVDVVLTDWNMPGMGGIDLVRALRSDPERQHIPVVLITSRQVREDVVEAAQAGVNGYIIKPFTPEVLRDRLQSVLARRADLPEADEPAANDDTPPAPGAAPRAAEGAVKDDPAAPGSESAAA